MEKSILFVDDEGQILRSLNRLFLDKNYNIFLANDGESALKIIDTEKIDLLITDIKMPYMNGYELLKKVKEKYPNILRVAFSGYTDNKKICKALENNLAKLYIFKPWNNENLLSTIEQIFEFENTLKSKHIFKLINSLDNIPTLPTLYQDLCELIENNADMDIITKKIEEDQAISSRILRIANSAFYNVKTGSVKDAIMYLGLSNLKSVVLSNSIFSTSHQNQHLTDILWRHSSFTNSIVLFIYKRLLNKKIPKTYESAGLLHDIGKVVLLNNFSEQYKKILSFIMKNKGSKIADLENEAFSVTHQEIGGYLLNWWEIPYPIVESALFHHTPLDKRVINTELVSIVHISGYYSWKFLGYKQFSNGLYDETFKALNTTKDDFEQLLLELNI